MWYYKTRVGTFWILDRCVSGKVHDYLLGFQDESIHAYKDYQRAMEDVKNKQTGCLEWDTDHRMVPPKGLQDWAQGEPYDWQ